MLGGKNETQCHEISLLADCSRQLQPCRKGPVNVCVWPSARHPPSSIRISDGKSRVQRCPGRMLEHLRNLTRRSRPHRTGCPTAHTCTHLPDRKPGFQRMSVSVCTAEVEAAEPSPPDSGCCAGSSDGCVLVAASIKEAVRRRDTIASNPPPPPPSEA